MDIEVEWEGEENFKRSTPFTTVSLDIDTEAVTNKVLSTKDKWISRSKDYPFFTLGRGAYLDGKTKEYYKGLPAENEMMVQTFAGLYTEVGEALNSVFAENIYLTTQLRVPGFHIFPSDKKFLKITGNWHQDHPHVTLGLEDVDSYKQIRKHNEHSIRS